MPSSRAKRLSGHDKSYRRAVVQQSQPPAAIYIRIDPRVVANAVKKLCERMNLGPAKFTGHSLRSVGATAMAQKGVDLGLIVNHGRWQKPQMVFCH